MKLPSKQAPMALCILVLISSGAGGCAGRKAAAQQPASVRSNHVERLRSDLARIFSDTNFAGAQWSVLIVSLDRGEPLFGINASQLGMPASNNKLLTAAAALIRLGPDFRYGTAVAVDGTVADGVLHGNLRILGSGDPTFSARFHDGDSLAPMKAWAAKIRGAGIRKIEGNMVGDARAFSPRMLGRGWAWDDLAYGYAAPVSALQFNDNSLTVEIRPGAGEGTPAACRPLLIPDYLAVDCQVRTGTRFGEADLEVERSGSGEAVVVRGSVPMGSPPVSQAVAVRDPTLFFLRAFRTVLEEAGVDTSTCRLHGDPADAVSPENLRVIGNYSSPPLSEILKPLLKASQNLYSETLVRTLGRCVGGEGSFDRGREVVEQVLRGMAIEKGTYRYADGSGLSRLNLVSADLLVRILKYMHRHPYAQVFFDSLPIAGVDGTIATRMKGTAAENNVRAKTGTIAHVRALSGYVRTADGEMLAFAMLANNFLVSNRAAEYVQDAALERLANFTRK